MTTDSLGARISQGFSGVWEKGSQGVFGAWKKASCYAPCLPIVGPLIHGMGNSKGKKAENGKKVPQEDKKVLGAGPEGEGISQSVEEYARYALIGVGLSIITFVALAIIKMIAMSLALVAGVGFAFYGARLMNQSSK